MKKGLLFLLSIMLFLCCGTLVSCSSFPFNNRSSEYDPAAWGAKDYPFAKETGLEVLRCLDENDVETFKSLFSESVMSQPDTQKEIEMIFDFYKGKSISHDEVRSGESGAKFREDHYEYKSIYIKIHNILTDEGKSYNLEIDYVLVDDEDPSKIGISKILFRDDNGDFAL